MSFESNLEDMEGLRLVLATEKSTPKILKAVDDYMAGKDGDIVPSYILELRDWLVKMGNATTKNKQGELVSVPKTAARKLMEAVDTGRDYLRRNE